MKSLSLEMLHSCVVPVAMDTIIVLEGNCENGPFMLRDCILLLTSTHTVYVFIYMIWLYAQMFYLK